MAAQEERPIVEPAIMGRDLRPDRPKADLAVRLDGISWGAVFAGAVVAIVTQLVLSLFGLSFGAGTLDPGTADNPTVRAFSIVAAVWWAVSSILAVGFGAYVAGRLAGRPRVSTGGWHGLVTWALTTVVMFWLVGTTVGNVVGGTLRTVTDAASMVGQAAQTGIASATDPLGAIDRAVQDAIPSSNPGASRDAAIAAVRAALSGGSAEAREQAAQSLSEASGMTIEQARQQVQQYEGQYRAQRDQFEAGATDVAEASAQAVSRGALPDDSAPRT